jgi:uncharacterized cupredoxin-like copper-binding protein
MTPSFRAALFGAAVSLAPLAGCAGGSDVFGDPKAGYLADAAARVASVDWSRAEAVTVVLSEYRFAPDALEFRAGAPYRLRITNDGSVTHFFASGPFFRAIAAQRLTGPSGTVESPYLEEIAVPPGTVRELSFVAVGVGVYEFRCMAPFHAGFGMTGEIRVI